MEQFMSGYLPWLYQQQQQQQHKQPPPVPFLSLPPQPLPPLLRQQQNSACSTFSIDEILGHRSRAIATSESRIRSQTDGEDAMLEQIRSQYELCQQQHQQQQQQEEVLQGRGKRIRTIFTPDQLERLEAEFDRQQYMVGSERFYLATELSLTEAQVKVWFQNRRIKWRKQHLSEQRSQLMQLQRQTVGDVSMLDGEAHAASSSQATLRSHQAGTAGCCVSDLSGASSSEPEAGEQ